MDSERAETRLPESSDDDVASSRGSSHTVWLWISIPVLLALFSCHAWESRHRYLDQDELEHLNAAYFMTRGQTIYADFFENHPPLTAMLLQPIVRSTEDPHVLIHRARLLMLGLAAGILLATGFLARGLGGLPAAVLSAVFLLSHSFFFQKAMEVRPDVPALLFLTLALLALLRAVSGGSRRWLAMAGVLFCTAGLFTPKVIYAAGGASLATAFAAWNRAPSARARAAAGTLAAIGLGALAVAALAAAVMARQGILRGFWTDVVGASVNMRIDALAEIRWSYLNMTIALNTVTWMLAALGIVVLLRRRNKPMAGEVHVLLWSVTAGLVGLFLIGAPLRQYYLTFLPPLAVLAALGALELARWIEMRRSPLVAGTASIFVVLAATLPAILFAVRTASPMERQIGIMRKVIEVTDRNDLVFDCWTGLFLTRLPAYRYFYLNTDVQCLLPPDAMERDLLLSLQDPRVKLVIADAFVAQLPGTFQAYLRERFAPIPEFSFLWLRNE